MGAERDNMGISDERNTCFLSKLVSGFESARRDHADLQGSHGACPRNRLVEGFDSWNYRIPPSLMATSNLQRRTYFHRVFVPAFCGRARYSRPTPDMIRPRDTYELSFDPVPEFVIRLCGTKSFRTTGGRLIPRV